MKPDAARVMSSLTTAILDRFAVRHRVLYGHAMGSPGRRHILLVIADQLAAEALPAYGDPATIAPHLTELARCGTVFERALCASPLCVPSRGALMTGLLPSRTGAIDNAGELPASVPTFAHRLRLLGYRTVLTGKMHFVGADQLHGFEERPMTDVYPAGLDWVPDWRLADDERLPWYHDLSSVLRAGPVRATLQQDFDTEVAFRARRAIVDSARDPSRPLLLVASFTHPHDPYEVAARYWDRYDGVSIPPPRHPDPPDPPDVSTGRLRTMLDADRTPVTAEQVAAARRGYRAAISLVDDHVGTLLATLDEQGLREDTVVVVTSDHGDMLGERGLWYKMAPFEPSIRVPLIVAGRGVCAARVAEPVSLLDLAPTLVELAGGAADADLDGRSLAGALQGVPLPPRDVAVEYLAEGVRSPQVLLVRGSLKLIRTHGEPDVLYDLDDDPDERRDLAGDPARAADVAALAAEADRRWDLQRLDTEVRHGQAQRRLTAAALATGTVTAWDHPSPDDGAGRYIRTGRDFWSTLERARRV
jgi:choline-sulfatase